MTYTIIGYRPNLTPAARGMLNNLIGAEIADGLFSPGDTPDGAIIQHNGDPVLLETSRGVLVPAIGGEYLTTNPEPHKYTGDEYLADLYEAVELFMRNIWRPNGNNNPGGSSRAVYQTNAVEARMGSQEAGLFRRRSEVNHLGD